MKDMKYIKFETIIKDINDVLNKNSVQRAGYNKVDIEYGFEEIFRLCFGMSYYDCNMKEFKKLNEEQQFEIVIRDVEDCLKNNEEYIKLSYDRGMDFCNYEKKFYFYNVYLKDYERRNNFDKQKLFRNLDIEGEQRSALIELMKLQIASGIDYDSVIKLMTEYERNKRPDLYKLVARTECNQDEMSFETYHVGNSALALIFDYEQCNTYAKLIMEKSRLCILGDEKCCSEEYWSGKHRTYSEFKDSSKKLDGARELIELCRESKNESEGYKFIFWSLMMLAVDENDAEEHLALICDFAKMLGVTEDEFEDLIYVVKLIFQSVTTEYLFKSEKIPMYFGEVFNMYSGMKIKDVVEV